MKKACVLLTLMCILFFYGVGTGFSGNLSDSQTEALLANAKKNSFTDGEKMRSFPNTEDVSAFVGKNKARFRSARTEFSTDPEDLKPLLGTTWTFTYTIVSTYTDKISFDTEMITLDDGTVVLACYNEYGSDGVVMYGDFPSEAGGGSGFMAMIMSDSLNEYYFFKISGNTTTGYWMGEDAVTEENTALYPITGAKVGGTEPPSDGYLVTPQLWIRAVIHTVEKGPVEAVWKLGGEGSTARGDKVIWGHFYASPSDVSWGSQENPDLFVKIWSDAGGRLDVNFFHVSVPDIEVYSDYPYDGSPDEHGTTTMEKRYIRQYFQNGQSFSDEKRDDGDPAPGYMQTGNPSGYTTINNLRIGSMIRTEEKGPVQAVWQLGGQSSTSRGDQVVWGHFYANPSDVTWGSQENPDLFVKIWFDAGGRIDVNFFHVSVPDIEVYSDYPKDGDYDDKGTAIMDNRYLRHEYQKTDNGSGTQNYGMIIGVTKDMNGNVVGGVTVTTGYLSATSNEQGYFSIANVTEAQDAVVSFSKQGYVGTSEITNIRTGLSSFLEATMSPEGTRQEISAGSGGTVSHMDGSVVIKPGSLITSGGSSFTGTAEVSVTTFDPTTEEGRNAFPGKFEGVSVSGETIPILSYGFMDVTVRDENGAELQLGPDKTANISIPIPYSLRESAPASMPLWYFRQSDGKWYEEGLLTKKEDAYEGTISHFSIWNSDVGYDRSWVRGTVVDCSGNPIECARVTIKGISPRNCWDSGETCTPADGSFGPVPVDANAVCEIWASKNGVNSQPMQFTAYGYDQTLYWGNIQLCIETPLITISLIWGENPDDLDSHLTIPNPDGTRDHLYYDTNMMSVGGAVLDTDDITSYGPEVITVRSLHDGVYRYSVHHYSGTGTISSSGASVNMVIEGLGIYNLTPPSGATGEDDVWRLWDITVEDGKVAKVSTINDYLNGVSDYDIKPFSP